jgi:hypothetical protein
MNQNMEDVENNPFFANKKPEWDKKKDTATPALDFFWLDLTKEAQDW